MNTMRNLSLIGDFVIIFVFSVNISYGQTIDTTYRGFSDVDTTERNHPPSMLCMDVKPQHSVDIDHIMGMWYGSEIIIHSQDVPGVFAYDSCVIIQLSDVSDQMRDYNYRRTTPQFNQQQRGNGNSNDDNNHFNHMKFLRLVWSEKDDHLEYTFNYTQHSAGLWKNVGEQRGSLVSLNQYTQFTGSVQVVKAVNDHLVLTFCGNDAKSSIYTIVLSRTSLGLSSDELRSIRNLLSRRGLYTETIRKVCTSSAAAAVLQISSIFVILLGTLAIVRKY